MLVKDLRRLLGTASSPTLHMMLPSGEFVPPNFHITEIGRVHKTFIDCGGTRRESLSCVLQVWTANDLQHRLSAEKLAKIFDVSESVLGSDDLPIEVEYGPDVAARYFLADIEVTPSGLLFVLAAKQTDCLAPDKCGVATGCTTDGCC